MNRDGVVIVGAGQAGYQLAVSLRAAGYAGRVRVVGDEGVMPYQRPPLSKAFLAGTCDLSQITFQNVDFFQREKIELIAGRSVTSIDRGSHTIRTDDGDGLQYEHLVLAVGARVRKLPFQVDSTSGLHYLRTLADAQALRQALPTASNIVVIGAGFLGLEFASIAVAAGKQVTVVETSNEIMGHAVSPIVAQAFRRHHEAKGMKFLFGDSVSGLQTASGRITGARTPSGQILPTEMIVVCIGVVPNVELAAQAELPVNNGIVVDSCLRTVDPAIFALGDCATFPTRFSNEPCRLESIQNAMDQARHLALTIASKSDGSFDALPWFWSDQGGLKLQIAGLRRGVDQSVVRGNIDSKRFSVFGFRQDRLIAVESVASPGDHMAARRLLAGGTKVSAEMVADPSVSLKNL
jgi:3-phenylpropionate/trans-cinnamate dioxygenase ferredoxin reductase component